MAIKEESVLNQFVNEISTESDIIETQKYVEKGLPNKKEGPIKKIWDQVLGLWAYVKSNDVSWINKILPVAGLAYLVSPIDAVPDYIPGIGLLDDAGIIGLIVFKMGAVLTPYIKKIKKEKSEVEKPVKKNIINEESLKPWQRTIIIIIPDDNDRVFETDLPLYTISKAASLFKFSPGHPKVNTAYATIDKVIPDQYIVLSEYQKFYNEKKFSAFKELCASLGAKEMKLKSAVENGIELDIHANAIISEGIKIGMGTSSGKKKSIAETLELSFSGKNKGIKEFSSPWLDFEPKWIELRNMRNYSLENATIEYEYEDNLGISTELSANLEKCDISVGGKFEKINSIKYAYTITFYN
ncbi:DUF1232 domain-containing protein [Treponema primitia]|uniref:YkvA family protein n=1 Tax=Treponema primitia TaxID=88058 RepID=UPI00397EB153